MKKYEIVARLSDNTYTPKSKHGTYSIKSSVHGDVLTVKFSTIVNFASESSLRPQIESARDHAQQLIKSFIADLKKSYKNETEETLKLADKGSDDNIEVIQSTSNSLRKVAYFRFNSTLVIE